MQDFVVLLAPSANRVYAKATPRLAAAELAVLVPQATEVRITQLGGADAIEFKATEQDLPAAQGGSTALVGFVREGELLRPLEGAAPDFFDDDLVTIPKYQGKTNERFTRLLMNLTLSQVTSNTGQLAILDPMAGRGTTLLTAWQLGHDAYGVEADPKAVEALEAYVKTYLRRGRYKHDAKTSPVRRDGKRLGRRLDVSVRLAQRELTMAVFTGDTTDSAQLYGKKRFDAIITDAPYGVVHGAVQNGAVKNSAAQNSAAQNSSVRNSAARGVSTRQRSPHDLLQSALPIWASQLKPGGALGLAWNTFGLSREELVDMVSATGLEVRNTGPWLDFAHRVDSSINRDLLVAVNLAGRGQ